MMDFPNSPTAGQSFTSGGTTWVWTVPPSAWKATSGPSGGASYLPITGGQLNPGGLLVGTAGSVPGTGGLTLNANTVAPPAGEAGNVYVVAADGASPKLALDGFGSGGTTIIEARKSLGTAASPSAITSGTIIYIISAVGRGATTYGSQGQTLVQAIENWTDSARGTAMNFYTTPTGSTALVSSLILAGNSATFSGNVTQGGNYYYFNNATGTVFGSSTGPFIYADNNNFYSQIGTGGSAFFRWQTNNGTVSLMSLDTGGNLTIFGGNATKAAGTTWANPSARDLKENIQDYSQGLQAILALQPRTYKFRADSGFSTKETHIGLVHDETAHMPEMHTRAVLGGTADKPGREVDALDCSAITFALCNAIKELKAEIDDLKIQLSKKA